MSKQTNDHEFLGQVKLDYAYVHVGYSKCDHNFVKFAM